MTIHFAGENTSVLAVVIVYFLLAIALALGFYGSLNLVARLRKKVKRGDLSPLVAKSAGLLLAIVMAIVCVILPLTLSQNIEAYDAPIGLLVYFAVLGPAVIIVIVDAAKK